MIARIDVVDLARDARRQVGEQVERRAADLIEGHCAAQRRIALLVGKHVARVRDASTCQRAHRAGRDAVDADAARAVVIGEITHTRLKASLGDAHDVVVRHDADRPGIGQRDHRSAFVHQGCRVLGDLGEGEARDHHCADEILARGVGVEALEFVLVGKADGMHQEVDAAPLFLQSLEGRRNRRAVFDVARDDQRGADLFGQRLDAAAEGLALIGESQFSAVLGKLLGDAPGNGVVVRDAHDEPALALHQSVHVGVPMRNGAGKRAWRWCRRSRRSWTGPYRSWRCRCACARSACLRIPDRVPRYARSRR